LRLAAAGLPFTAIDSRDAYANQVGLSDGVPARRQRAESWFVDPADGIGICNVPLPARPID